MGELLNHMDGLHADDCAVELIVHAVSEPDRYERERMGVWEWMASFTTRPVKAGLPTLFELQQADAEDRHRMQLIALVAIADELAEAVDQLKEEAATCSSVRNSTGMHRTTSQPYPPSLGGRA